MDNFLPIMPLQENCEEEIAEVVSLDQAGLLPAPKPPVSETDLQLTLGGGGEVVALTLLRAGLHLGWRR